jgi:1-deoxy-D-xylulose-5-phosphate synthase
MATTSYPLLQTINDPADLRRLSRAELKVLATSCVDFVLDSVSKTGGHLSPTWARWS